MASSNENISMAVFCDFENVALGVRDANYEKFDIKPVLERLLLKGSIVVKKAYCDWDRYKGFKATMHEANFELIEIPHVRQSGKNSADIRLVVDALDLCYTKSHVNTFVIISGDSDFSPLVSKLRENAKQVIGVGVKQSTSDLLVANCDEFIFYDDLVREVKRAAAKRDERKQPPARKSPDEGNRRKEELESRKAQAIELVVEMFDALVSERGDSGKIWASLLKDTLKRRRPDFNETYYGFRTFGNLLEEAQNRGMLEFGRDEKSGAYVYRSAALAADRAAASGDVNGGDDQIDQHDGPEGEELLDAAPAEQPDEQPARQERPARGEARRGRGRGGRDRAVADEPAVQADAEQEDEQPHEQPLEQSLEQPLEQPHELSQEQPQEQQRREQQPRAQQPRERQARGQQPREKQVRDQQVRGQQPREKQSRDQQPRDQQPRPPRQERPARADAQRGRGRGAHNPGPVDDLYLEQKQHHLLEQQREQLEQQRDEREQYEPLEPVAVQPQAQEPQERAAGSDARRGRGGRNKAADAPQHDAAGDGAGASAQAKVDAEPPAPDAPVAEKRRAPRKPAAKKAAKQEDASSAAVQSQPQADAAGDAAEAVVKKPARARRPAKKAAEQAAE